MNDIDENLITSRVAVSQSRQPAILPRLDPYERRMFLEKCKRRSLRPGQPLFDQGMAHEFTYLINFGLVRTYYLAASGREITLAYWSDGDLVGGPDLFGGHIHVWSAKAMKVTEVLAMSGPDLRELSIKCPSVAVSVIEALSFKLRWLSLLFQMHGTESVVQRLARLLIMLGEMYGVRHDDGINIKHHFSQSDLASLAGASRQWISRALHQFQDIGLIRVRHRRLIIRDLDGLRQISERT